jgi:hypothetical protein
MFPDVDEMADLDIGDYGASIESLGFGNEDADGSSECVCARETMFLYDSLHV